jgi:hypothetical protein
MTLIPALGRLRQEDWNFKARLGFIGRPCHKNKKLKNLRRFKFFFVCLFGDTGV